MDRAAPVRSGSAGPEAGVSGISSAEVHEFLTRTPRQLPSRYFYDALGSVLFEAICELPWYGIARAELALLERRAHAILPASAGAARVVELGPGNGTKLAALLEAAGNRAPEVHLVDVSRRALDAAVHTLASRGVAHCIVHERSYEQGLREATAGGFDGSTLVLLLGSNIGNFEPAAADAFLRHIRSALRDGDTLLLGADLVKAERELVLAYDDPIGVTAAFNRNLLHRVNQELDGDFRLDRFAHRAIWNRAASRVEMHLVSLEQQSIHVRKAGLAFTMERDEFIWTESSHKYTPLDIVSRLERAGFNVTRQWIDERNRLALTLAAVESARSAPRLRSIR